MMKNLIINLIEKYQRHKDPIKYWRKKGAKIGNNCEIYSTTNFGSEPFLISIGNHVRINMNVQLITHDGGVWVLREYLNDLNSEKIDLFGKITIGNNVHIGDNCIIGCGAIVTSNIPNNSIAVGIPARVIENIEEYYEKNKVRFDYTKKMNNKEKKIYLLRKQK